MSVSRSAGSEMVIVKGRLGIPVADVLFFQEKWNGLGYFRVDQ